MRTAHPAKTRARAVRLLSAGRLSVTEIARRVAVPRRTVQAWARQAGLPPRGPTTRSVGLTPATQRRVVALYLEGVRMRRIELVTGASPPQVRRLVRAAGHPLRTCHTCGRFDTHEVDALAVALGVAKAARRLGCAINTVIYHQRKALRLRVRAELLAEERARKRGRRAA